jgi:hypothetical protein
VSHAWPRRVCWGPAQLADLDVLINVARLNAAFVCTTQNRPTDKKLGDDAACAPHVDRKAVAGGPQQDFWGSVPTTANLLLSVTRVGVAGARETKICDAQVAVLVQKNVGRLVPAG